MPQGESVQQTDFDVLIVGAGISGIGAACHIKRLCPDRSFALFEGREALGGTWYLFRYPGIRSDSDMYTLGYAFKPWTERKAIADGPSILKYLNETVDDNELRDRIFFRHRITRADWSSAANCWTVSVDINGGEETLAYTCNFLFLCGGYYKYDAGYTPDFPGLKDFQGELIHPQQWPEDANYTGRKVVIIGSGATAVTLLPELAKRAEQVTMLQRSPTYMLSRPAVDAFALRLQKLLPAKWSYGLVRWRNVLLTLFLFQFSRKRPQTMKNYLINQVRKHLDADYDVDQHFTPRYGPWDQRLCLVPDDDLFDAINSGKARIVTDKIDTFTGNGIKLLSGQTLEADLVVTATGLQLEVFNGISVSVDGQHVDPGSRFTYRGLMYNDVPNLATSFGYTNASWTLRADLTCAYVCRLLNHMAKTGASRCTPRLDQPEMTPSNWFDLSSGYVQRSAGKLPKQGDRNPWRAPQNYLIDIFNLRFRKVNHEVLEFARSRSAGAELPAGSSG